MRLMFFLLTLIFSGPAGAQFIQNLNTPQVSVADHADAGRRIARAQRSDNQRAAWRRHRLLQRQFDGDDYNRVPDRRGSVVHVSAL